MLRVVAYKRLKTMEKSIVNRQAKKVVAVKLDQG